MSDLEALRAENERLRRDAEQLRARVKEAEEGVRATRALFAATIESLPFDFWARDQNGYCFSQNATTRANWGDLLLKRPEDMDLTSDVIEAWQANNRRALSGEIVRGDIDYELRGEVRHMHNVLAPIRLDDEIVGTLGLNIDITERKRAEAELSFALGELRASNEKLRMAVDGSGIGLWSWDVQADVVTWDARLCSIYGVPLERAPRRRAEYLALLAPGDRERSEAALAQHLVEGHWEDEVSVLRKDGSTQWVLTKGTVLRSAGRDVVVGVILDITDRRRKDEQLREAQKLEAVGQLTAGIAHNFNNMLMGILPNIQMAAKKASPEIAPLLANAEGAASRAADLVRQLMAYAGRNRPSERSIVAVSELVERTVSFCRTTFDKRITILQTYDQAARSFLDATQIEQALLNVLINARDAVAMERHRAPAHSSSPSESPRVEVTVDLVRGVVPDLQPLAGDWVRVQVRDNGPGMTRETAGRIYQPFFTTKGVGHGTGLGLATTHAILREHGGAILCDSGLGEGTTFSMYLPAAAGAASPAPSPPVLQVSKGAGTVMVVDDEPSIRFVLKLILQDAGFEVLLASSGDEVVDELSDRVRASAVALVLLDVSMPGMSADTLRRRIRDLAPRARVLYLTGYSVEAADLADAVLEKPVSAERLLAKIREVLDRE